MWCSHDLCAVTGKITTGTYTPIQYTIGILCGLTRRLRRSDVANVVKYVYISAIW